MMILIFVLLLHAQQTPPLVLQHELSPPGPHLAPLHPYLLRASLDVTERLGFRENYRGLSASPA